MTLYFPKRWSGKLVCPLTLTLGSNIWNESGEHGHHRTYPRNWGAVTYPCWPWLPEPALRPWCVRWRPWGTQTRLVACHRQWRCAADVGLKKLCPGETQAFVMFFIILRETAQQIIQDTRKVVYRIYWIINFLPQKRKEGYAGISITFLRWRNKYWSEISITTL